MSRRPDRPLPEPVRRPARGFSRGTSVRPSTSEPARDAPRPTPAGLRGPIGTLRGRHPAGLFFTAALVLLPATSGVQGTLSDYRRAVGLRGQIQGLFVNVAESPGWISTSNRSWYRKECRRRQRVRDVRCRGQDEAADHRPHAACGGPFPGARQACTAVTLPFSTFTFIDNEQAIEFNAQQLRFRCTIRAVACSLQPMSAGRTDARRTRGARLARARNVHKEDRCGTRHLTEDGGPTTSRTSTTGPPARGRAEIAMFALRHGLFSPMA